MDDIIWLCDRGMQVKKTRNGQALYIKIPEAFIVNNGIENNEKFSLFMAGSELRIRRMPNGNAGALDRDS